MKMNRQSLAATSLAILITAACFAQAPTRWRGPEESGIYPEVGLLKEWPAGGPGILWTFEQLGQGHSSPVVQGKHLYINGMIDTKGYLFKFDLDGNLLYRAEYGPEFKESWNGTRGSPVIAGDLVYIISGYGQIYCLKEADGKQVWMADLIHEYGGEVPTWGHNETPVVYGDVIYCTPGGRTHNVIALNRHNGSLVWSCPGKGEMPAYCSPLLFTHGGRAILATHTKSHLLGIDVSSGNLLWTQPQTNQYSVHANTPLYRDGGLLYFSGYGRGAVKVDLNGDGSQISPAWKNETFDSRMGGAVLVNGYLYGSGDQYREWKCLDWNTGKTMYSSTEIAKGNVIYADGMLYCYTERGEFALVKADPGKFNLVSRTMVEKGSEQHWAHTVIHDGVLYLRHGNALVAYRIKQR